MKKIVLSLALLAGVTATAQAQTRFGLKVGVVAATIAGKDADAFGDPSNRFGFQAGLTTTTTFGVGELFQFHPELLYSQKGFQIEDFSKTTFHNIDVPLLLRVNAAGLFFEAGPQLGYLFAQKTKGDSSVGGGSNTDTDDFNKFQVGYIAGVGYELESGPSLTVRYNGGITKVFDDNDAKIRNSVFQFQFGFAFPGSK